MRKKLLDFIALRKNAANHLEKELGYAVKTILGYERHWKQLQEFMYENKIPLYNQKVGNAFLKSYFLIASDYSKQTSIIAIRILTKYQNNTLEHTRKLPDKYPLTFDGPIGTIISSFIFYLASKGRSRSTLHSHQRVLFDFNKYCKTKEINNVDKIDIAFLLTYINQMHCPFKSNMTIAITAIRGFIKFLYEEGYHTRDISRKIPKVKHVSRPKISSVYSKKEMKILLESIDRTTSQGKRNYLIIMLASRYGLRASDICNLKFENIDWEKNIITIVQHKTLNELSLPLLSDVGNAIIDYVKYGRKKSGEKKFILLLARPPYGKFTNSNTVTHIVQRAIIKVGLRTKNRKFGPHSLRHSLGFEMLQNATSINVITQIYGHSSQESSRYYLRIDLKSMLPCTLSVPQISKEFYYQRGGIFYE
ncbi:site-specific recombinase XerD [Maribacter spongiicola]|uniref:Site-specific recombinase XerD n=1 Tax=Maribacter spongiicola TaxID=1206753 RepID=A0A4R7K7J0_9FLAO|nr:tyrosine-type recombinase/integrase [Maribacter spongiicola]TDT47040.1 site-specific recombinase XerD [Maribacter spongiicola]